MQLDTMLHPSDQAIAQVRTVFRRYHCGEADYPDATLDRLLGIAPYASEQRVNEQRLVEHFGNEQYTYEGTPYAFLRLFLYTIQPTQRDVVYDLGCGYGRMVFYGALTTPARYTGIEIVPQRVAEAQFVIHRLNLKNATVVEGNVLEVGYRDGTVFFLFNPFTEGTLRQVIRELHDIAHDHPISILTWGGGSTGLFAREDWLEELPLPEVDGAPYFGRLRLFRSTSV